MASREAHNFARNLSRSFSRKFARKFARSVMIRSSDYRLNGKANVAASVSRAFVCSTLDCAAPKKVDRSSTLQKLRNKLLCRQWCGVTGNIELLPFAMLNAFADLRGRFVFARLFIS